MVTYLASRRLGEFLVARRVLSRDDLNELLAREATEGIELATLLQLEHVVSDHDLTAAVASELGVHFADLAEQTILPDVWGLLPGAVAREHLTVALERTADGIVVAMADPRDDDAMRALEAELRTTVIPAVAVREELLRLIEEMYGRAALAGTPATDSVEGSVTALARGVKLDYLLDEVVRVGGSDLHLTVGSPPVVRVQGALRRMPGLAPLNGSEVRRLVLGLLTDKQRERFLEVGELATSHALPGKGRFRVSAFVQRDSVGAVLRLVPGEIPSPEDLGLPDVVTDWADERRGLVLVCGPHGSGLSTTLAALVDRISKTRASHILTIEEPIEFLHRHQLGLVNQREVGEDTESFSSGLRCALRQDPDVVVAGELPDIESIRLALNAAETGHLVLASLPTINAVQTIERIVEVFPVDHQPQARVQLANTLRGIVVQQLVPALDGGRVLATEVLLPATPVVEAIRSGDSVGITKAMLGGATSGMGIMDQSLAELVREGIVDLEVAIDHALDPAELQYLLSDHLR